MFNLGLRAIVERDHGKQFLVLFICGCEVVVYLDSNPQDVFHHMGFDCPVWNCNHPFNNPADTMAHYGFCTPYTYEKGNA